MFWQKPRFHQIWSKLGNVYKYMKKLTWDKLKFQNQKHSHLYICLSCCCLCDEKRICCAPYSAVYGFTHTTGINQQPIWYCSCADNPKYTSAKSIECCTRIGSREQLLSIRLVVKSSKQCALWSPNQWTKSEICVFWCWYQSQYFLLISPVLGSWVSPSRGRFQNDGNYS